MEHIRRCFMAACFAILAACGTIQAPEVHFYNGSEEGKPGPSINILVTPSSHEVTPSEQLQKDSSSFEDFLLAKAISKHFKCSLQVALDSIKFANLYSHKDFPKRDDILAIIAVESRFNPEASYRGSKGVMQVLVKTHRDKISGKFDLPQQIRVGRNILRQSYELTGSSSKAAVMAYNVGIGAYLRGSRPTGYYHKYTLQLAWIKSQERGLGLV